MEDKRTALAMFLIIVFVMMYSEYVLSPYTKQAVQPSQQTASQNLEGSQPTQDTPATPDSSLAPSLTSGANPALSPVTTTAAPPFLSQLRESAKTVIKTPLIEATITHLGARLLSLKLQQYADHIGDSARLDLVVLSDDTPAPLGIYVGSANDAHVNYTLESASSSMGQVDGGFELERGQEIALVYSGTFSEGIAIKKIFTFRGDSYQFAVETRVNPPPLTGAPVWIEWGRYISDQAQHNSLDPFTISVLSDAQKVNHTSVQAVASSISEPYGALWTGISDKYFTSTLVPQIPGMNSRFGKDKNVFLVRVRGDESGGTVNVYAGPKEYGTLQTAGSQLERTIDLGFFSFLAYPLLMLLRFFYGLLGNYGLAIVMLTLFVKSVFFPLTRASLKSMKAMQEIAPEMQALRERVKDPTQLNQEMLALYKKRGVNPMGGCLPIMVQIPVFFGLYSALQHSIELRHAPFVFWVHDLSAPERMELAGIRFPVMIILMGIVMFIQQYRTPTPGMDPSQRKMMLGVSVAFTLGFIIFPFPAGLALYTLVNTLTSLIQQSVLRSDKHANPFRVTLLASIGIFSFAYVLTLLS